MISPIPLRALALCLLVAVPPSALAAPASTPRWWIAGGGGIVWPPAELQIEKTRPAAGVILAPTFAPPWALEGRAHTLQSDRQQKTQITHVDGNLTLFAASGAWISPYLTGGAGLIWIKTQGATESKFAWNGGAGFRVRLNERWALRTDVRDISYQVPDPSTRDDRFRHCAEWFGGLQYEFGAAAPDRDGDGVPNKLDLCPDTPTGARVDAKGCPLDGDGDGVYDGLDACEGTRKGCTVNPNGCPTDADQDGICDGLDQCPDTPATARVDVKGCPIVVSEKETELLQTGMIRLQNVNFDTARSTIKEESFPVLDEVGGILLHWPDLRIEIGGHTDSRGGEAYNQELSEERAQAVLAYLTEKFPDLRAEQYTAAGYGESRPLVPNTSVLNMAKNRRVEFRVLNTEALKRERERQRVLEKE